MSEKLNPTTIEKVAFEAETDAIAAEALGIDAPTLRTTLRACHEFSKAWYRGRFLREMADLASTPICEIEAAKHFGFTGPGFSVLFSFDHEAKDVWNAHRRRLNIKMAEAVVANAANGSPSAVRYCERLLRTQLPAPGQGQEIVSDVKSLRTNHE